MAQLHSSDIFLFDGQGTPASFAPQTISTALRDARLPLGNALLKACFKTFKEELAVLTPAEKSASGLDESQFSVPLSLIDVPSHLMVNAVIANCHLYLIQCLRYLAALHASDSNATGVIPDASSPTFVGFSTGMFAATVLAVSDDIPSLFSGAVEMYRLAFWIGLRAQEYASQAVSGQSSFDASSPWSLVLFGSNREDVDSTVQRFNNDHPSVPAVHVTAATNATCLSVSGRPDALSDFRSNYLPATCGSSKYASIHTLYHAPDLREVKHHIMEDVTRRNIYFPSFDSLKHGLRSTLNGELVAAEREGAAPTLLEEVVDMTMLHPVNYDHVAAAICSDPSLKDAPVRLINVGPGVSLWRGTVRLLQALNVAVIDWTSLSVSDSYTPAPPAIMDAAPPREPIAIVGMAVNMPGAPDVNRLWEVLEKGLNTVSEIPRERFDVSKYTAAPKGAKRSLKTRFGNFIENPDAFDNAFFRISPREARSMDPQQRVLLQTSYHALENSGYVPNATPSFNTDTFATYVGVATNDYVQNLRNDIDVYYSTGTLQAFLSGKLAYAFGFSAPSIVVDTACSSSVIAIYQACRALVNGDCNAALAGGVNVIASPDMYFGLDRAHFLSPTGQCKPWDASADGYCRSEGCGMFVLKRLSDALAENDNILGVIRGIEVNQSANAESITHPHVATQVQLFKKLLSSTGLPPTRISVIEAHGTGTQAGDPTELESIRSVFAVNRTPENPLHVTSVKANIGHLEAASGTAGLAKLVLMLQKRTIPAVISLKQLNPRIPDLSLDHTVIDTQMTSWSAPADGSKRLALLNNFGAAGSNGALILEEPPVRAAARAADAAAPAVFVVGLSCDSEAAAERLLKAYLQAIEDLPQEQFSLADFAYTATARRRLLRFRVAAAGNSREQLRASLEKAKIVDVGKDHGKIVFVFSGQGGQYVGMGAGLYKGTPAFRRIVDECDSKLVSWGYSSILGIINPSGEDTAAPEEAFQPAVFVLEYALASLWMSWGIQPDAVAGHSLGEYAALVVAGVITLHGALKIVAERARLMFQKCVPKATGMLAVRMSPWNMAGVLDPEKYEKVSIACYNSTADCVVAGDLEQLRSLQAELKQAGSKTILLNVPYGYHTFAMEPILADLRTIGGEIKISAPTVPIASNVHGVVVEAGDATRFTSDYFARHCGEPVQFEQAITKLMGRNGFSTVTAWIELGPHPTTLPMLRSIPLAAQSTMHVASLKKDTQDWEFLCSTLSSLYCSSAQIAWRNVFADLAPASKLMALPAYPFADTKYWVKFEDDAPLSSAITQVSPIASSPRFTLLGSCVSMPAPDTEESAVFETPISLVSHLIEGHAVAGSALCPASVYHELALGAALIMLEKTGRMTPDLVLDLSEIVYANPLVYSPDVRRTIKTEITPMDGAEKHSGKFVVSSYTPESPEPQAHCSGFFVRRSTAYVSSKLSLSKTTIERRIQPLRNGPRTSETFFTHTAYNVIFSRVVQYSKAYHTMKSVTIDMNGVDAFAVVQMPPESATGSFVVHPIFMDTLLHAAGFVINCNAGQDEAFICSQVDKVKAIPELINSNTTYGVYCNIGFLSETLAVADAYAIELDGPTGHVVAHIKRMRFRKLRMNGFKRLLAMAGQGASPHAHAGSSQAATQSRTASHNGTAKPTNNGAGWESKVMSLIAETCGVPASDLTMQSRLSDLGIDSLMSIELAGRIQALLPSCGLDSNAVAAFNHVGDLILELKDKFGSDTPASSETLHEDEAPSTLVSPIQAPQAESPLGMIKDIMSSILGVPARELADNADLEHMGLDSLTSIEARHALETTLHVKLAEDVFTVCRTVKDLCTAITMMLSPPSEVPQIKLGIKGEPTKLPTFGIEVNPVRLLDGGNTELLPLFLIHDGSGMAHPYGRITSLGRTLWGIHNPKLPVGQPWEGGLLEMAGHYVELIKANGGKNGCIVGGWSFGGVVAFEVARQLIKSGVSVPGIVLIDCPHPRTKSPLPDSLIDNVIGAKDSTNTLTQLVRAQMKFATRALISYDITQSPASDVSPPKAVMLRSQEGFPLPTVQTESAAFLAERRDPAASVAQWEDVLGTKVPIIDIPGNHFEPFEPKYVGTVSEKLKEALDMLQ